MLAIQLPTLIVLVASPISWAVASTSLLTSALKIASKPTASASGATERISEARQPTPGTIPKAKRSTIGLSLLLRNVTGKTTTLLRRLLKAPIGGAYFNLVPLSRLLGNHHWCLTNADGVLQDPVTRLMKVDHLLRTAMTRYLH